jgi:Raf kinase inhibitor-like YbhB/YbcL family protein
MFTLVCQSYKDKEPIPTKYSHSSVVGGKNISPAFSWSDPPVNTKSFAFSIIDPHPVAKNWVHWFVINIPFRERKLVEGASRTNSLPPGAKELMNSYNELGYGGPAPPKGSGEHPYVATIYALNVESLDLGVNTTLRQFHKAIEGKVIAEATMTGTYERK